MTKGTQILDGRYNDVLGRKTLGPYRSRVWNGGDWSTAIAGKEVKKSIFSKRPPSWYSRKADSYSYLFKDKDERAIIRRHHILYEGWKREWQAWKSNLAAYKEWKAAQTTRNTENHPYTVSISKSLITAAYIARWDNLAGAPPYPESPLSAFGRPTTPDIWTPDDSNATIEKFREKLSNIKGFHAGVAVAELDKTLDMITDNAKVLRRFGQRLSKGDVAGALRVLYNGKHSANIDGFAGLQRGAQQYLAYQFGLKPLIEDMEGCGAFIAYTQLNQKTIRVRVTRTREADFKPSNPQVYMMQCHRVQSWRIVAFLKTAPTSLEVSGLLDVPSILWERLTASFLVDWWFKIGLALSAMQMARVLQGQFVATWYQKAEFGPYQSGSVYRIIDDSSSAVDLQITRKIRTDLNVEVPKLRPIFHPDTTVRMRHATESIALVAVNQKKIVKGLDWLKARWAQYGPLPKI